MAKENTNSSEKSTGSDKPKVTLAERFQSVLRWIDYNILPLIALPALAVLAADDIRSHLAHVSTEVGLFTAIAIAAILAVKSHNK
jgi:hypothetical protein